MFTFNLTLVAQILNFLILVVILTKYAYKPIMQAMKDRQERIANDLAAAEKERLAAEQMRLEYQEQITRARLQAQEIVDKAVKTAEQMRQEILAEARAEHARMLKSTQEEIARQTELAIAGIRGEVVALTMSAATKVIEKEMTNETNAKLVADFIEKLDQKKIGGLPC